MSDLLYGRPIRISAKNSFVLSQFTDLTGRRTDGRTDGRKSRANTALHSMLRGKI